MITPLINTLSFYYKFYPLIYGIVCAYHVYNYYEHVKVITHYLQLLRYKKLNEDMPKEEDYEWIFIEEELLEDDDTHFDLNMMILITEPDVIIEETTTNSTEREGETSDIDEESMNTVKLVEIPI